MKKTYADKCLERAEKATEGPWTVIDDEYGLRIPEVKGICEGCVGWLKPAYEEEAEFIAHSRTDVPELARRLKAAIDLLKDFENTKGLFAYGLAYRIQELEKDIENE